MPPLSRLAAAFRPPTRRSAASLLDCQKWKFCHAPPTSHSAPRRALPFDRRAIDARAAFAPSLHGRSRTTTCRWASHVRLSGTRGRRAARARHVSICVKFVRKRTKIAKIFRLRRGASGRRGQVGRLRPARPKVLPPCGRRRGFVEYHIYVTHLLGFRP